MITSGTGRVYYYILVPSSLSYAELRAGFNALLDRIYRVRRWDYSFRCPRPPKRVHLTPLRWRLPICHKKARPRVIRYRNA